MKRATLLAAGLLGFAYASFGQGALVFDNWSNFENYNPLAYAAWTPDTPNSFMGDGYQLTPGTTNITGFDFIPMNGTSNNLLGVKINVYIWGSINQGAVGPSTPAFGNLLGLYTATLSQSIPSSNYFAFESFPPGSAPYITLNPPLAIPGTNVGITINYEGTVDGTTYSNMDDLTSLVTYGLPDSVGGADFNGFYINNNSEMNGNFIEGYTQFIGGYPFQTVGLRIYGNIQTGNQVPLANPQSVNVLKNTSKNITLAANDPDGDPLTYGIVNYPTNGTLTGTPPNVTYTPNANYVGPDAFTFKANDGITDSPPALVSLNVTTLAGLIIIPTWDTTILSDPQVVSITNTIITSILSYETRFSDPVTVNITFVETNSGLGESLTYYDDSHSYSDYYNALVANAKTTNDSVVLAHLSGGASNPVNGGANIRSTLPLLRALGFPNEYSSPSGPGSLDGTILLNMSKINITRPPANPNNYDLQAVASHEIDEVLGTISGLTEPYIRPADLFRYSGPGTRNYTTSGDSAYFSIDGGNTLQAQYNQDSRGDYGDWWSVVYPHSPVRVQDAFASPGTAPDLGVELTVLDSVGWTLVSAIPVIVPQPLVHELHSGTTMVLTWNSAVGAKYQVQYTTNLVHTNWVSLGGPITASTTTTTNIDTSLTDHQRFYRVQVLPSGSVVFAPATMSQKTVNGTFGVYKHVTHPRSDLYPGSAQVVAPRQLPVQAIPATNQNSP